MCSLIERRAMLLCKCKTPFEPLLCFLAPAGFLLFTARRCHSTRIPTYPPRDRGIAHFSVSSDNILGLGSMSQSKSDYNATGGVTSVRVNRRNVHWMYLSQFFWGPVSLSTHLWRFWVTYKLQRSRFSILLGGRCCNTLVRSLVVIVARVLKLTRAFRIRAGCCC